MECIAALHAVRRKGVHGFEQFKFVLVQLWMYVVKKYSANTDKNAKKFFFHSQ
jgi:hypothetical protein